MVKIYFGVPGSGKTTHAAHIVLKNLKAGFPTFSNVEIKGAFLYSAEDDLGQFEITQCDVIIDEASIEFNNRRYKTMSMLIIKWLKLYRHHLVRNIYVYSQDYEDMDITLRRLSVEMYCLSPLIKGRLFLERRIGVRFGIDDQTHQPSKQYYFKRFGFRFYRGKPTWPLFDSWTVDPLPFKDFPLFGCDRLLSETKSEDLKRIYKEIKGKRKHLSD